MDLSNRKGFVKISAGAGVIIILAVLLLFSSSFLTPTAFPSDLSGQVTGSMMDEAFGNGQGTNGNSPVLINFNKMGNGNGDDQGDETGDGTGDDEGDESEETGGSGGFFIPASVGSTGGGGPVITCHHMECDYGQRACVQVSGEVANECSIFDDCIHTECSDEECVTIDNPGDDECVTDDECVEECIPPYLDLDKTANPGEVFCEEVEITLTVSGEGEICDPHYPVDVVLVFDNSGSMDDDGGSPPQPITDAKNAAKAFVDLLGTNDKAGLVSFNTVATLEHPLTFDKNNVKTAIDGMSAGDWTNMSQGIDYGNKELIDNGRTDIPWVEVLLSDGNNNCGSDNPPPDCHQKVFDSAQEAADNGIVIYTIALGNISNQTMMQEIADITGGNFYYAPNSSDLQEIYEEIAENITDMVASDVTVIDYLPIYAELNLSSLPAGCTHNDTLRKITCDIGEVHLNETYEFMFRIYMYQVGYNLTNLYPNSGVNYTDYNLTGQFLAFPETHVTVIAYDCDHTVCNYDQEICELVDEPGVDECEDFFTDCPQHTVCNYIDDICETVEGQGPDECSVYADCIHTECNYQAYTCDTTDTPGIDECVTFDDCDQYTVCNYSAQTCDIVEGVGIDECATFNDCTHTACCGMSCIDVNSAGPDECSTDMDCTDYVCNYDTFTCDAVPGNGYIECQSFIPDCGECDEDIDCDYLDRDYCEGDDIMHVEGVCIDVTCVEGPPEEIENCYYHENYCDDVEVWEEIGFCNPVGVYCDSYDNFLEDCYYYTEYCDGEVRTYDQGFCNPDGVYCDDDTDNEIEDCSDNNYDDCQDTYYKRHYTESCYEDQGSTSCLPASSLIDCRDDLWCNGQEYCSEEGGVHCEDGDQVDCSDNDIDGVAECYFNPDNNGDTFDYRDLFNSECVEDGQSSGHCTEGDDTVQHACADDDDTDGIFYYDGSTRACEAECDEDTDCDQTTSECEPSGKKLGTRDPYGYCNEFCGCEYDEFTYRCVIDQCGAECEIAPSDDECPDTNGDDIIDGDDLVIVDDNYGRNDCVGPDWCNGADVNHDGKVGVIDLGLVGLWYGTTCSAIDCPETGCEDHCVGPDWYQYTGDVPNECLDSCECTENSCVLEDIIEDDPRCTHTECDYPTEECVIVEGEDVDECSVWDNCVHDICDYSSFTCEERPIYEEGDACDFNTDCFDKICDYDLDICKPVEPGTPGDACSTWDDCVVEECGNGVLDPGEECEENSDCDSPPQSKCVGVDWHQYSNPGTCLGDCTCKYDLVIRECDSRCMGNCDRNNIKVLVGHWMNPKWPGQFPYGVTDDIYIEAMTTDQDCLNEEITITYNWCSCPNLDPEQSAIETTIWPPKYDRLCTANARSSGTESLACTPCRRRDWDVTFTQTNKWYREWTGAGIPGACEGTFQIDLRDDDCYVAAYLGLRGPPALGCAGSCEDHPEEKPAMRGICSKSDTCELVAASVSGEACKIDSDCVEEETHLICQSEQCVEVPVSVTGESCTCLEDCQPDPEPEPEPETHLECIDLDVCAEVEGPGPDLCTYWKDCSGPYEPPTM